MDHYRETFDTWNRIAQAYEDKFMKLDIYNESYDIFLAPLPSGSKVLDIGCGPGNISRYLLGRRPDLKITGVDAAPEMVKRAAKNNPDASFRVLDCRQILQTDSAFNAIICGFCIPYLSAGEAGKLIQDCSVLLDKEGSLYLSFVEGHSSLSGFKTGSNGMRSYFNYHELTQLTKDLHQAGFKMQQNMKVKYALSEGKSEDHTILIARK